MSPRLPSDLHICGPSAYSRGTVCSWSMGLPCGPQGWRCDGCKTNSKHVATLQQKRFQTCKSYTENLIEWWTNIVHLVLVKAMKVFVWTSSEGASGQRHPSVAGSSFVPAPRSSAAACQAEWPMSEYVALEGYCAFRVDLVFLAWRTHSCTFSKLQIHMH